MLVIFKGRYRYLTFIKLVKGIGLLKLARYNKS